MADKNLQDTTLRFIFLTTLIVVTLAQKDTSVCIDFKPSQNAPKKPALPNMYSVAVECNIQNKNFTTNYHEWFDYKNNRAAVTEHDTGAHENAIYSFDTNELITVDRDTKQCKVDPLSMDPNRQLFGYATSDGKAHIYTAGGALDFGRNFSEQWINQTTIRGIQCNLWRSCVYWDSINATMVVDWYFSVSSWTTSTLMSNVPVRAHVKGRVWQLGVPRDFEHLYEFTEFRNTIDRRTVFETGEGVFCPGRKLTKPLPSPADYFHFQAEILQSDVNLIGHIKEYFDRNMSLVRYDYTPMGPDPYGPDAQIQVHDFNTGVAYIMDPIRGNCSLSNISAQGFDTRTATDGIHVRIRTSQEFFYFDSKSYSYEGTKLVRGILCDVWITQRNDWPNPGSGINSTWEWYFATGSYAQKSGSNLQFGMPIMLVLNGNTLGRYQYNIFAYDEERPSIWDFDISPCFNYTTRKDFKFILPGNFQKVVLANEELFKYYVLLSIQGSAGVSPLRVSNIQVDYADNKDIIVSFTLLDKAPPIGDVTNPSKEISLDAAVNTLTTAINGGSFVVKMNVDTLPNTISLTAKPYSFSSTQARVVTNINYVNQQQASTSTSGYSGGVLAGLGVALLVIFFILGVLGTYYYYRRLGGAFQHKPFNNQDITKDAS